MPALNLVLTEAGLDALVDAQAGTTDPIVIAELGLSSESFTVAPTLEALPHEFKRIEAVAGQSAAANIIHMVAQDSSDEVYSAYGVGLFLADGTLFATYAQATPIVNKVSIAAFLIAFDVAFMDAIDTAIEFGDASFLYPPATETTKGVAEIATTAEADAGTDTQRIMTPSLVKRIVDAAATTLTAAITALTGRTITGAGLASGGGDLSANRVVTVTAASGAELQAATAADRAVTPASFGALPRLLGATGYSVDPGGKWEAWGSVTVPTPGTATVTLPITFPNSVRRVLISPESERDSGDENDEPLFVNPASFTDNGFTIQATRDGLSGSVAWYAIGD